MPFLPAHPRNTIQGHDMDQMQADRFRQSAQAARFLATREHSDHIAAALSPEDQCVQSMPDASPAKWHRAHTTWFFEQFLLRPHLPGYQVFDDTFCFLFNSYYDAVGARHPRPLRGLLTRPSSVEVDAYRRHVDAAMVRLLERDDPALVPLIELGLHHEQQHQELLLTDMLHAFSCSMLAPPVIPGWVEPAHESGPTRWLDHPGGLVAIGHDSSGFAFDNEGPRHQALLQPHQLASRLVRNGEWLDFIADGGYRTSTLWMSDGWAAAQAGGWTAPLHWRRMEDAWQQMGLGGLSPLDPQAPVRHLSWYEADAYARWAGARLPTEFELEAHPANGAEFDGHVWQWSNSAYLPYPGFRPAEGAVGEYNGKFMINQMVLRGSSLATPPGHARATYRNFFPPSARWQFTGLRLARDV